MSKQTGWRVWAASTGLALLAAGPAVVLEAQEAIRSVNDGVYTEAQAERGRVAYTKNCQVCHGETLAGIEAAVALSGAPFIGNWSGQTVADLATRARTTMPKDRPGTLRSATITDIIAQILKTNGYPAGGAELPRDSQLLQLIRIDAPKFPHMFDHPTTAPT